MTNQVVSYWNRGRQLLPKTGFILDCINPSISKHKSSIYRELTDMPGTQLASFISLVLISLRWFYMDLCGAGSLPAVRQAILVECNDGEIIYVH